jgi:hypothetical protein
MPYLPPPMELPALSQALLGTVALRDKVVVVRLEPAALASPEHVEGIGRTLALLRALDLRVIVVHAAPEGAHPGGAPQLIAAIGRHDQRALALLPHGVVRTLPLVPFPLVDQALLIQLCSLRYVPILMMPVLDDAARPVDLSADQVAAAIARFLDAVMVVHVHAGEAASPPRVEGEPPAVAVRAGDSDAMLGELLARAPLKRGEP